MLEMLLLLAGLILAPIFIVIFGLSIAMMSPIQVAAFCVFGVIFLGNLWVQRRQR